MNREIQTIIDNANRDCRTVSSGQIRKLIHHVIGLEKTMAKVAELADTGTQMHKIIFDPYAVGEIPSGWRVAEKMREHLLAVLSSDRPTGDLEALERAVRVVEYLDDPQVLLEIPQPHRLKLSELLHGKSG